MTDENADDVLARALRKAFVGRSSAPAKDMIDALRDAGMI